MRRPGCRGRRKGEETDGTVIDNGARIRERRGKVVRPKGAGYAGARNRGRAREKDGKG